MKNIDFKGGDIRYDPYKDIIDWDKEVNDDIYGYISQDMFKVYYEKFLIDIGWYNDHFTLMIISIPSVGDPLTYEERYLYNWDNPVAVIKCKDSFDMLHQLQKAINFYTKYLSLY